MNSGVTTTNGNMKTIEPNLVRKGAKVVLTSGLEGEVRCNKKGIVRMIEVPNFHGTTDKGDEYVYKWRLAIQDGETFRVVLPEKLQKQADKIKAMLDSMR